MAKPAKPVKQWIAAVQGAVAALATGAVIGPIAWFSMLGKPAVPALISIDLLCGITIGVFTSAFVAWIAFLLIMCQRTRSTWPRRFLLAFGFAFAMFLGVSIVQILFDVRPISWENWRPLIWMFVQAAVGLTCAFAVGFRCGTLPPLSGCCWKCDYDLSGNTSGVCPECGTKVDDASRNVGREHGSAHRDNGPSQDTINNQPPEWGTGS